MTFDDIYARAPINSTAARVTSQSGCASDDTLTDEQRRENLVAQVKLIRDRIKALPKGSEERKLLGLQYRDVCDQINALRPAKRARGVQQHFIDAARDMLTRPQFNALMDSAVSRLRSAEDVDTESDDIRATQGGAG